MGKRTTIGCTIEEETKKEIERIIEEHKYINTKSQFLQVAIKQLLEKERRNNVE